MAKWSEVVLKSLIVVILLTIPTLSLETFAGCIREDPKDKRFAVISSEPIVLTCDEPKTVGNRTELATEYCSVVLAGKSGGNYRVLTDKKHCGVKGKNKELHLAKLCCDQPEYQVTCYRYLHHKELASLETIACAREFEWALFDPKRLKKDSGVRNFGPGKESLK